MSDFNYMIGQGKIIDAILETSINSDMTGIIRAVVSRDVYAEKGDIVLVPRGSRLIGNCSFDSNIVKSRINISWNRIILPSGGDVVISSPGTDELGIPGVTGIVDNKVMHKLFSSIMVTGVSIGAAIVSQKASILTSGTTAVQMISGIIANTIDISSINDILGLPDDVELKLKSQAVKRLQGAKTESSLMSFFRDEVKRAVDKLKPKPQDWDPKKVNEITIESIKNVLRAQGGPSVYENIVQNSIKDFAQDMRETINNNVDTKPTVYVNQGTALKVFVNQDIIFPSCT
ncbi:TraB/TrbI/VirB10 family type IV secretion system protein [Wolbachia pipientis]|uniref:TrbI/VirB10 family protein n=1 Tax=Wolbachia pipientis TaxID=955 RepID=UPI000A8C16A7|nr:TrbI/VirB10 family protein [Wolbachia pipientis]